MRDAPVNPQPVALVGAAPDGTITHWSAGAQELYGWTEPEILGRHLSTLAAAGTPHLSLERERLLAGGDSQPFHARCRTRAGEVFTARVSLTLLRDDRGEVIGTLARHADPDVGGRDSELRAGFEDSPVPQSRLDLQGRVLAVNAAMERLRGETAADLVGRDALDAYVPEERPGLEQALARLASGAEHFVSRDQTLQLADGRHLHVCMTVTAMRDKDGKAVLAGSLEDVTALREAEQAVRTQAVRFDAVLQSMPIAVVTYDAAGVCTSASGRALPDLGVTADDLVGHNLLELLAVVPNSLAALEASLAGDEGRVVAEMGEHVWEGNYRPTLNADGAVTGGLAVGLQITQRVAAERAVLANEARLRALLEYATDVVVVLDRKARLLYVSPAIRRHLGYDDRNLFWQPSGDFDHPEDRPVVESAWRRVMRTPGSTEVFESRVRHADGSWRWTEHVMTNLLDTPGIEGVVVNLRDVTERREHEQRLQHLALHDGLTGLANRALLLDRLGQAMAWGRRDDNQSGLVLLDLRGMSKINAVAGQQVGDVVLQAVAERLTEAVRETDSVARVGGDDFAVLIEDVASVEELRARAADLREALSTPVVVDGVSIAVELRVGTALTPADSPGALLAAAERALDAELDKAAAAVAPRGLHTDDPADVAELRQAIAAGQLRMHLQPVMSLGDGTMAGAEALVRWQHPERGLLMPGAFIGLAERSGLIADLGEWVLRRACAQAAAWEKAGSPIGVGVNLSPRQLVGAGVIDLVREVLRTTGVSPGRLILEVTESAVMDDPQAPDVLRALHDMGVRLALDDFGTGYSSLTYLKRFPVDALKIDRSFVSGLGRDRDDEAIVASIVSLARSIGKIVVAEGVETREQLAVLRALGVDQAQGFLWSPALTPALLEIWLAEHVPLPAVVVPRLAPLPPLPVALGEGERRILQLNAEGASLHTIAAALNAEGRRTAAGPRWTTTTVARVIAALSR